MVQSSSGLGCLVPRSRTMTLATTPPPEATSSMDADILYEIVNGERVELPPTGVYMAWIASRLCAKLEQFAEDHELGRAVTEMLFRISTAPNLQRRPDVA